MIRKTWLGDLHKRGIDWSKKLIAKQAVSSPSPKMVGVLETAQILLFVIIIKNNKQKSTAKILEKFICQNDERRSD